MDSHNASLLYSKVFQLIQTTSSKMCISDYTYKDNLPLSIPEFFIHTHLFFGKKINIADLLLKSFSKKYNDKIMIILIRDFKDVITSQFMHDVHRSNQKRFFGNILELHCF